jgi:hypothetical protein
MILQLTSQVTKLRIFICADSVTVTDAAGLTEYGSSTLRRGCVVDDGKHNNGGYRVEESYDEVTYMIISQADPDMGRTAFAIMRSA